MVVDESPRPLIAACRPFEEQPTAAIIPNAVANPTNQADEPETGSTESASRRQPKASIFMEVILPQTAQVATGAGRDKHSWLS